MFTIRRFHLPLILLLGLLLSCVGMTTALAYPELDMTFSWENADQTLTITMVKPGTRGGKLFLPGSCDGGSLQVTLSGYDEVLWGDKTLHTGDVLDVSGDIGTTVTVAAPDGRTILPVQVMRGSAIPAMFVTLTEADLKHISNSKQNDIREDASILMVEGDGSIACDDSLTSFHMRGNSTRYTPKKPFQLKLAHKADLGGMGKDKTWILLANWFDVSLIRNQITYDLCKELGLTGTPECRQVDLYINGSYNGTYLLTEKIQIDKGRLNITDLEEELEQLNDQPLDSFKQRSGSKNGVGVVKWFNIPNEPEDVTGGYLLEIEKALQFSRNKESGGFTTDGGMCVIIKEPSQVGPEGAGYIAALVNDFHNAVLAKDGVSRKTGRYYGDFIDMRSFAMKIIVEELSANFDAKAASQFMYKDSDAVDSKLYAGPGWDYDLTYGDKETAQCKPLRPDYVYRRSSDTSHLYHYLLDHEDFAALTRSLLLSDAVPAVEVLLGRREAAGFTYVRPIDDYVADIAASADMNFTRWITSVINELYIPSGKNFPDATAYLKDWISQRIDMLAEQWLADAA